MIYGTETSEVAQRSYLRGLGSGDDTYEKIEIWNRGLPAKIKRFRYDTRPTLTVTASDKTVVYGGSKPTFSASYSGFKDGDSTSRNDLSGTLTYACEYAAGSAVGTFSITPSGRTSTKYNISYVAGTLTVTKKALTVTVADVTMAAGGTEPTYSATASGFITDEDETDLTGSITYTVKNSGGETVADVTSAATGEYSIVATGYTSSNYEISYVAGTLTIT